MFAVVGTALAFLLHLFDEFVRKHAIDFRMGEYACWAKRWIVWGRYGIDGPDPVSYFHLMLPSYEWCFDICRRQWGFARRVLCWSSTHGWEINYMF